MADLRAKLLELLDGHLRLAEKATPGPWTTLDEFGTPWNVRDSTDGDVALAQQRLGGGRQDHERRANAEWIAASRSFAPMALRALRAEISRHY